jgi:hypothetical protein
MKTLFSISETTDLNCHICGKDLLDPPNGHLVIKNELKNDKRVILDILWVCSNCDWGLFKQWGWKDISDLFIPECLVSFILGILAGLHGGYESFSDKAMENLMKFLLIIFPHISKELTVEQKRELKDLYEIPRFLGGLG